MNGDAAVTHGPGRPRPVGASSILVGTGAAVVFLALAVLSSILQLPGLTALSLFLLLLSVTARLWSTAALRGLAVSIEAETTRMFVGGETRLRCSVQNGKRLPLIWLELLLDVPRRDCILPAPEDFEHYELPPQEFSQTGKSHALRKRLAFLAGHETLQVESIWTARRRGVYTLDAALLRTGDGFGLMQTELRAPIAGTPVFVIYPPLVPVDTGPFLRMQWEGDTGSRGFLDDPSVLRGMKRYEPTDPWKRINWRMAARQQELSVNLYETIAPQSAHFLLDGESFCGLSEDFAELEDCLSVLCSLLLQLSEAGMHCGLSLPRGLEREPVNLPAGSTELSELLLSLAGYDCLAKSDAEASAKAGQTVYFPSAFDGRLAASLAATAGHSYYVTHDAAAFLRDAPSLRLDQGQLTLLCFRETAESERLALGPVRALSLREVKR